MDSPFRHKIDEIYEQKRSTKIRWKKTIDFLAEFPSGKLGLDIGDRTKLTNQCEEYFGVPFENTDIDLDEQSLDGTFDIITSFEVVEHLFNPLFHLKQAHQSLKDSGRLYLSMPSFKPRILQSSNHFHEMTRPSMEALFQRAGFEILRESNFRIRPFWYYFTGFRPFLRGFYEKIVIFELAKQSEKS
ncbi:methyltransferase domain-containing protein [bacterium]|nr:methyltransferase domain-containing protein [bacterium]